MQDLFPHVLYINLASRPDRRTHIEEQLKLVGLPHFERFDAVHMPSGDGRVGCTLSHLRCLELAQSRQYPSVLLCEDDTLFLQPDVLQKQVRAFMAKKRPWDVVLLGGNNVPPYALVDDTCIRVSWCQTTTCYLVPQHYYSRLITNIKTGLDLLLREPTQHFYYAIDKYWRKLQHEDQWFLITPLTVVQREDYSDIEKRRTNYGALMIDLDKKALLEAVVMEKNRKAQAAAAQAQAAAHGPTGLAPV